MLSRVKTESGLFMRLPLRQDLTYYAVRKALKRMLDAFQQRAPTYWDDATYICMFGKSELEVGGGAELGKEL